MRRRKDKDGTTILEGDNLTVALAIALFYPIGSVLASVDATNPGTRFTGTTWVAFGAGRALVGVGSNGVNAYTAEQTFGADSIQLTDAQSGTNEHWHTITGTTSGHSANHTHNQSILSKSLNPGTTSSDNAGAKVVQGSPSGAFNGTQSGVTAGASNDHTHTLPFNTDASVDAWQPVVTAHENRPSSIAVYLWKRTA